MEVRRKPKLLIIGHGRHGKDTAAKLIEQLMGLSFESSSEFVGKRAVWPFWGKERYDCFEQCFNDRTNNRKLWGDLIAAYCTPNKSRTAEELFAAGNDMYVGLRRIPEYDACMDKDLFDLVIWVDAILRHPPENKDSNEMTKEHAHYIINNNGTEDDLANQVCKLQDYLHAEGFEVNWREDNIPTAIVEDVQSTWMDKPTNAIQVLDHGFFEVKEVMGSDESIAASARMSYGRGTKKINNDAGLINYLVRNHHTSPLEMGEIRVHMRLPIFVMRQLVRHRTANLNEYSGRYSEMVRLFYTPELSEIMCQGNTNKQMSGAALPEDEARHAQAIITQSSNRSFDIYEKLLDQDVSRETARIVLPLNTYTEVVWKMDVSNLIKFLHLRDDDHAQWEIQVYAKLIAETLQHYFPLVYAAYENARESTSLTEAQIRALIIGVFPGHNMSKSEAAQVESILDTHVPLC